MSYNNWLGLDNYKPDSFKSKTAWLNQQLNAMLYTNKQALRLIHKSTKHNKDHTDSKDLTIPMGNYVLLHNHPEGRNKIQDKYKPDVYVVVGHHQEPNVYYIQLLNKDKLGHPEVVNQHQLFDLNMFTPPSVTTSFDDGFAVVLSFVNKQNSKSNNSNFGHLQLPHHYNTCSKWKAAATSK